MADKISGKIVKIGGGTAIFEDSFDGHRGLIASGVPIAHTSSNCWISVG